MTLNTSTFDSLYSFLEHNRKPTKAGKGFQLVEQFCANHNLDPVTLKELCFYFGANTDEEVLAKVKGNVLGKAILRPWGYNSNKMARS